MRGFKTKEEAEVGLKDGIIIKNKKVNVALLVKCFDYPDDPFLLKADPTMCKGLYVYNNTYEPGSYWREPLDINEYNFLKGVLKK